MIHRRQLVTSALSLLAAPATVRADSLMALTGVPLDPWVIGHRVLRSPSGPLEWESEWHYSMFNYAAPCGAWGIPGFNKLSVDQKLKYLTPPTWEKKRLSEVLSKHLHLREETE